MPAISTPRGISPAAGGNGGEIGVAGPGGRNAAVDRVAGRRVVEDHDGRSGARIERGLLDGAVPVYVKTSEVARDIAGLATGDARRELRLLATGVLDDLPDGVRSALLAVDDLGDRLVTISRDLGEAILTWDTVLDRATLGRLFAGITAVHRRFAGAAPPGLCPLPTRISLFAPRRLDAIRPANPGLVAAVARGQELLVDLVPDEIAAVVHRAYDDPGPLAAAMAAEGTTLLHGDFFLPNVALEPLPADGTAPDGSAPDQPAPDRAAPGRPAPDGEVVEPNAAERDALVLVDWGLATEGPAALDLVSFCLGAMSNVSMSRAELVAAARRACRDLSGDATFACCELWALMELGWNKALDAIDHPDPAKRATERADLDFWVARARAGLDAGLVPDPAPRPDPAPGS